MSPAPSERTDPNHLPLAERRELAALLTKPRRRSDPDPAPHVTTIYHGAPTGDVLFNEKADAAFDAERRKVEAARENLLSELKSARARFYASLQADPVLRRARAAHRRRLKRGEGSALDLRPRIAHLRREAFRRAASMADHPEHSVPQRTASRERASRSQRRHGGHSRTSSRSPGRSSSESDEPPPERPCPSCCSGSITKPARGPWSTRCERCRRARDAARKRASRAASLTTGERLRARLLALDPREAVAEWDALAAPERAELVEVLAIPRSEDVLAAIVAPRRPAGVTT